MPLPPSIYPTSLSLRPSPWVWVGAIGVIQRVILAYNKNSTGLQGPTPTGLRWAGLCHLEVEVGKGDGATDLRMQRQDVQA